MTAYKPETTANGIHMLIDETDSILVGFIDSTANLSINSSYVFADRLHLTTCVVTGSATVNTVLATPAIVSPTGTVNFNDDHIITTGNITANVATVDSVNNADFVQFDTSYADGSVEGRLQWNIDDGTLEVGMPGGNVTLQIGQEMLVRCRNTTGSTINNGSVVYVSGESGNKPLIALSKADAKATAIVFGLATENIAHNANGYVTTTGLVRSMNTNGLVEGDYVFLSATTAGGLETAPATAPNYKARVGYCLSTHNSEGVVYVDSSVVPLMKSLSDVYGAPSADVDFYVWSTDNSRFEIKIGTGDAWPQYSHLKTGWKDHMQSFNEVEVTYNTSNRTYTISPLVAAAEYWIGGIRYELTESQSVVWDDTTGPHYIYFTGNETTLTASTTFGTRWES